MLSSPPRRSAHPTILIARLFVAGLLYTAASTMLYAASEGPDCIDKDILLIGDEGVGKTSLMQRFIHNQFPGDYLPTINGALGDVREVTTEDGRKALLHIWELSGKKSTPSLLPTYALCKDAIVLCYDITKPLSLEALKKIWYPEIEKCIGEDDRPPIFLCGTHSEEKDGEGVLGSAEAMVKSFNSAANQEKAFAMMVSSKNGVLVDHFFRKIVQDMGWGMKLPPKTSHKKQPDTSTYHDGDRYQNPTANEQGEGKGIYIMVGVGMAVAAMVAIIYYFFGKAGTITRTPSQQAVQHGGVTKEE